MRHEVLLSSLEKLTHGSARFHQVRGLTSWGRQRPLGRPASVMPNLTKQILYQKIAYEFNSLGTQGFIRKSGKIPVLDVA